MSTNYYVMEETVCEKCGHKQLTGKTAHHIGKSSFGWCFALHVFTEDDVTLLTWKDWLEYLQDRTIQDDQGDVVPLDEFIQVVTERQMGGKDWGKGDVPPTYDSWQDFFDKNQAVVGPNNLLRRSLDNLHCVGYGEGPWDLVTGDFS